jgi:hypothetical protein
MRSPRVSIDSLAGLRLQWSASSVGQAPQDLTFSSPGTLPLAPPNREPATAPSIIKTGYTPPTMVTSADVPFAISHIQAAATSTIAAADEFAVAGSATASALTHSAAKSAVTPSVMNTSHDSSAASAAVAALAAAASTGGAKQPTTGTVTASGSKSLAFGSSSVQVPASYAIAIASRPADMSINSSGADVVTMQRPSTPVAMTSAPAPAEHQTTPVATSDNLVKKMPGAEGRATFIARESGFSPLEIVSNKSSDALKPASVGAVPGRSSSPEGPSNAVQRQIEKQIEMQEQTMQLSADADYGTSNSLSAAQATSHFGAPCCASIFGRGCGASCFRRTFIACQRAADDGAGIGGTASAA